MAKRYKAIRIVSNVYRFIGGLVFLFGIIVGVLTMISPSYSYDFGNGRLIPGAPMVGPGIGLIIASIITALSLYAFGELLQLLVAVEENTRQSTLLLSRMAKAQTQIRKFDSTPEPSMRSLLEG